MELGARELLTFATVLAGLASTWAVQHAIHRADREAASQSVIEAKVHVLAGILSPANLAIQNRQIATVIAVVDSLKDEVKALRALHNGTHK